MHQQARFAQGKGALAACTAVVLALSLMVPATALADPTSAEKQAEAEAALASLNAMQEQLDRASDNHFTALQEQEEAEANRDAAQARIDEANAQIADLQDRLGSRARSMYRSGNTSMLDLLLGSATFQAFANNWDLLNQINDDDAALVQQTKDLRAEVQQQEAVYAEQARVAEEKADEAARIEAEAAATVDSMQATYDSLSAEAAALLEQERAAEEAARAAAAAATVEASAQQGASNNNGGGNGGGGGSSFVPSYDPVTGNAVVDRAYGCIGAPYKWGGVGPSSFDCSGLVSYALSGSFSRLGTTDTFMGWPTVSDPQPGDVCVNDHHAGIYIGGGQMIHAPYTGATVCVSSVHSDMKIVRQP